ncbi:hypothetical protein HDU84_000083 [Entophlyctis sp. JEL0112]|nr:hypothetical protein HDU84_000083 [Entophlyctis sp. JEL0112]
MAADSATITVGQKAKRVISYTSSVHTRRVLPSLACTVALHQVSPKLSSKLWHLIFLSIRRRPELWKKVRYWPGVFYNGLLVPIIVLAVTACIFSKKLKNTTEPRTATDPLVAPDPVYSNDHKQLASKNEDSGFEEISTTSSVLLKDGLDVGTTPKTDSHERIDSNNDEEAVNSILLDNIPTITVHSQQSSTTVHDDIVKLIPLPKGPSNAQLLFSPQKKQSLRLSTLQTSSNAQLFVNPEVKSLAYSKMNLLALPTQFSTHNYLTRLHLNGNNISELPYACMMLLPSLTFLDICDNRISTLTKSVLHSKKLKELYVRNCGLVEIEEGVLEGLEMLEILDLSDNSLSHFSKFAFANASHLNTLCLSNNRISTLPPSLGLLRGRELVNLMIGGNQFDQGIKVFTDPVVTASQGIATRVSKELTQRQAFIPNEIYSGNSFGIGSKGSAIDYKSFGDWEDDDLRSSYETEFDPLFNVSPSGLGYSPIPHEYHKFRRRSSLPNAGRFLESKTTIVSHARRANDINSWDHIESKSTTSFHASTNPTYVHIQRLLSYLHDVFDLSQSLQRKDAADIRTARSRTGSKSENYPTPPMTNSSFTRSVSPDNSVEEKVMSQDDPEAPGLTEDERDNIRQRQSPSRRSHIITEILSTERTYVNELKTLMSLYVEPFERGILSPADINALFSNLKSILNFHKSQLLPRLETASQKNNQAFGAIFLEAVPYLRSYSIYYNNFDTANEMVSHLEQIVNAGNGQLQAPIRSTALNATSISPTATQASRKTLGKKFKNLVKIAKSSPSHHQISLQSYLILPVQRLPRYKLLLEQLLDSTPLKHEDRRTLELAVDAVRGCVTDLNDKKRQMEEVERGVRQLSRIRAISGKCTVDMRKFQSAAGANRQFVCEKSFRVLKHVERLSAGSDTLDAQFALISTRDRAVRSPLGTVVETRFIPNSSNSIMPPVAVVGQPHLGAGLDALSVYGVQTLTGCEYRFLLFSDMLCWCKPISTSASSSILSGTVSSSSSGISRLEKEFDLILAIDIGANTNVECMPILGQDDGFSGTNSTNGGGVFRLPERPNSNGIRAFASVQNLSNRSFSSAISLTNSRGSTASTLPTRAPPEPESVMRISDGSCVLYLRGSQANLEEFLGTLKGLGCLAEEN